MGTNNTLLSIAEEIYYAGTIDGYLHYWELGSCATGYTPWPQFQHDYGRTGVLE